MRDGSEVDKDSRYRRYRGRTSLNTRCKSAAEGRNGSASKTVWVEIGCGQKNTQATELMQRVGYLTACGSSGPLQLLTWVKLRYLRFGSYGCTKRTCPSHSPVHWLRRPSSRTAHDLKHSRKRATVNGCMVCLRFFTTTGAHNSRAEQGQLLPLPQLTGNRMRVWCMTMH